VVSRSHYKQPQFPPKVDFSGTSYYKLQASHVASHVDWPSRTLQLKQPGRTPSCCVTWQLQHCFFLWNNSIFYNRVPKNYNKKIYSSFEILSHYFIFIILVADGLSADLPELLFELLKVVTCSSFIFACKNHLSHPECQLVKTFHINPVSELKLFKESCNTIKSLN